MDKIKIKRIDTGWDQYHYEDENGEVWCHLSRGNTPPITCDCCGKSFDEGWTWNAVASVWFNLCPDCVEIV